MSQKLKSQFPNLTPTNYHITSPVDFDYNCIAWAADDPTRWWWPDVQNQKYWPSDVPREETLEAFILAYATLGYVVCDSGNSEDGFDKIVIYCLNGDPTHAAKISENSNWSSKLGQGNDISHKQNALNGPIYGTPETFMKRKRGNNLAVKDELDSDTKVNPLTGKPKNKS